MTVTLAASARLPTEFGDVLLCAYTNSFDDKEHLAIVRGAIEGRRGVLTRVHSECYTGDVLGSLRCDCGPQLEEAMRRIVAADCGIIIYLRQEGRGIGLVEKLKAYNLQDEGYDTVEANLMLGHSADARRYDIAAAILRDLRVASIQLMTNNPDKIDSLRAHAIEVDGRVPIEVPVHAEGERYMATKARRMGHLLSLGGPPGAPARPR